MRRVFADALYWRAVADPRDPYRSVAIRWAKILRDAQLVTTHEMLIEFVNALSDRGPYLRRAAVGIIAEIVSDARAEVLAQSELSFRAGWALYAARMDKGYSLTDCISMTAMSARGIVEVLTQDEHFAREGFRPLLRERP